MVVGRGCAPVIMIFKVVSCAAGHANIHKDEKVRFYFCVTCGPSSSVRRVFRASNVGDLISFVGYATLKHWPSSSLIIFGPASRGMPRNYPIRKNTHRVVMTPK